MSRYYLFDKKTGEITPTDDIEKFGEWCQDIDNKRIAETYTPNGYRVSTVALGLDHRFGGPEGLPIIFETMVFEKDKWTDLHCERYSTLAEAKAGHERAVEWAISR